MTQRPLEPVLTAQQLTDFFAEAFPAHEQDPEQFVRIEPGFDRMRQSPENAQLRPGGIVSGPTQMALADRIAYAVILAHIGIVPMAVTSNLNMSFLRGVRAETFYADALLEAYAQLPMPDDHEDRGLYVVSGDVTVSGQTFEAGQMLVFRPGDRISAQAGGQGARVGARSAGGGAGGDAVGGGECGGWREGGLGGRRRGGAADRGRGRDVGGGRRGG